MLHDKAVETVAESTLTAGANMERSEAQDLMDRYCKPAILLHRTFPPLDPTKTRSKLGGLPRLPDGIDWPRTTEGTPLHFLAEIDCRDLPDIGGQLPEQGVLFFFALIDEGAEALRDRRSGGSRVIFAPEVGAEAAAPPADLPRLMGGLSRYDRNFHLEDEPGVNLYRSWPVVGLPIRSWPDGWDLPESYPNDRELNTGNYDKAVLSARTAEIQSATGVQADYRERRYSLMVRFGVELRIDEGKEHVVLPKFGKKGEYSWIWRFADRVSRHIRNNSFERISFLTGRYGRIGYRMTEKEIEDELRYYSALKSKAEEWVRVASGYETGERMNESDIERFELWIKDMLRGNQKKPGSSIACAIRDSLLDVGHFIWSSQNSGDFDIEWLMDYLEVIYPFWPPHLPHQMLGNTSRAQPGWGTRGTVLGHETTLLQLESDDTFGFEFGDSGDLEFAIGTDDLAARRFDRAWATIECG